MVKPKPDVLSKCEWIAAGVISALALCLHLARLRYGGALWRDEVAALNLARMDWREILIYFPHEAFPLLFPALLRGYSSLAGTGNTALRIFGFSIGVICLATIWLNARVIRRHIPLVGLALFGFNPIFFIWGDSIRGYGLGAVLIMLTFGLFARTITKPGFAVFCGALVTSILSVQCLLANAILLFAIGISAAAAHLLQKRIKHASIVLGIGFIAALSIAPYYGPYQRAREWDVVLRTWLNFGWLWTRFCDALATPIPAMLWIWLVLFCGAIVGLDWFFRRPSIDPKEKALAVFAFSTCVLSLICYGIFLRVLGYPTQDWYYLALISLLIVTLDVVIGIVVANLEWLRVLRLVGVLVLGAALVLPASRISRVRMTNMDLVAENLKEKAGSDDLIIIVPWYIGISFGRQFESKIPWTTLPVVSDLKIHRYDLAKEQMALADPVGPLIKRAADTLRSGHRLWVVAPVAFAPTVRTPQYLAPAPYDPVGWNENSYRGAWSNQLEYFIGVHALNYTVQQLVPRPTNPYEKAQLMLVEGIRE